MATEAERAALRPLIDDTKQPYTFTNPELDRYLADAGGDTNQAAGMVWTALAAKYSHLVDTSEGASVRKMSQLHEQALKMAKYFKGGDTAQGSVIVPGRTRVGRIIRT